MFLVPIFLYQFDQNISHLVIPALLFLSMDVLLIKRFNNSAQNCSSGNIFNIDQKEIRRNYIKMYFLLALLLLTTYIKYFENIIEKLYFNGIFQEVMYPIIIMVPHLPSLDKIHDRNSIEATLFLYTFLSLYTAYLFETCLFDFIVRSYYEKYIYKHKITTNIERLSKEDMSDADNFLIIAYLIFGFFCSLMYTAICRTVVTATNNGFQFHLRNPMVVMMFLGSMWILGLCAGGITRLMLRKITSLVSLFPNSRD